MAEKPKVREFPDIGNKLTAPSKKTVFERQKAEAEAKRLREEKETAAVYEDFVKSFDNESTPGRDRDSGGARPGGFNDAGVGRTPGGFSKRHFSGALGRGGKISSGPGSLGPPHPSLARKRDHDELSSTKREGLFAFEDVRPPAGDLKKALQHSDDEDAEDRGEAQERAIPKPTLRLSSLPPGTSIAAIRAVLPSTLTVEGLKTQPSAGSDTGKQSSSAIVTLAKDTPALDIDTAVSALQNRYMGRGFYLSISRHLSSSATVLESSYALPSSSLSLPFNARPITGPSFGRGPMGGPHRGGYAPPSSYNSMQNQYGRGESQAQVIVTPPSDLKQLKLIHRTLEALLTHGPEFEALLMSRKAVQNEEKWAWLWDSRSIGGVYYRWRLWDILTGNPKRNQRGRVLGSAPQQVFENSAAWAPPGQKLPFEYTTELSEIVSDSDYNSSEDEDSGNEGRRRYAHHHGGAAPPDISMETESQAYLNPLQKAKLTHLLARLPTNHAKLRRGDVARVTAFAIQHAGAGAEEVVKMITANVHQPFAFTSANPEFRHTHRASIDQVTRDGSTNNETRPKDGKEDDEDSSPAKLLALYMISDILSTSSTSGVRQAWRYRSLFENCLRTHHTFAYLGRLEKVYNWGRLRAEKWRRSVQSLLSLWEGWCVFPQESQDGFAAEFANPPLTEAEIQAEAANKKLEEEREIEAENERRAENAMKGLSKWRSVGDSEMAASGGSGPDAMDVDEGINGAPMMAGLNSARYDDEDEDEDMDGEPMLEDDDNEEDVDGVPMSPSTRSSSTPPAAPATDPDEEQEPPAPTPAPASAPPSESAIDRRSALAASIAAKLGKAARTAASTSSDTGTTASNGTKTGPGGTGSSVLQGRKRQRPKAEDMFADSD